jgi:hypothetical protein
MQKASRPNFAFMRRASLFGYGNERDQAGRQQETKRKAKEELTERRAV